MISALSTKCQVVSGASIRACRGLYRHIVALEADEDLYQEVLVPYQSSDEEDSPPPTPPSPPRRPPSKVIMEPEVKRAPKRKCE